MSTEQPVAILTRPFSFSPVTGLMSTDGILVGGAGAAEIGAFIVNCTGGVLDDVVVRARVDDRSRIALTRPEARLKRIHPDTPTLVTFGVDAADAPPGIVDLTLEVTASAQDGTRVRATPNRGLFVAGRNGVPIERVTVPEGTITADILEWHTRAGGSPLPSRVKMTMVPTRAFAGTFSPLPFQDPLWKAAGAAMAEVSLTELVAVGTASTVVGVGIGSGVAAGTGGSKAAAVATGVVVAVAVAGLALLLLDGEDTFRWGEARTDVDEDEFTIREEVEAWFAGADGSIPEVGDASPAHAEWAFTRITNKGVHTCREVVPVSTRHYASTRRVTVSRPVVDAGEPFSVIAEFDKDGRALSGADLYVTARLVHQGRIVATFPLTDDGRLSAQPRTPGTYVGAYTPCANDPADLELFVVAQDVNDANPNDSPIVQARHLGGIVVSTPAIREGRMSPDARIGVRQLTEMR